MSRTDPIGFGQAAARTVLAQDRLRVLPGGGGRNGQLRHVRNLRPSQPTTTVPLELSLQDVTVLLAALGQYGVPASVAAIAERISGQMHPSLLPAWLSDDDAPAHGIPRPVSS